MKRAGPIVTACIVSALAGCGQKGPLYLPDEQTPVVEPPPSTPTAGTPPAPAPEKRDEEKEKPR